MGKFPRASRLVTAVCSTVIAFSASASCLFAAEVAGLAEASTAAEVLVAIVDSNGDGKVRDAECKAAVGKLRVIANAKSNGSRATKVSPEELRQAFDTDASGLVDVGEARTHVAKARLEIDEMAKRAEEAIQMIDGDSDGQVTANELGAFLQQRGNVGKQLAGDTSSLFRSLDTDRDEGVSVEEAVLRADAFLRFRVTFEVTDEQDAAAWLGSLRVLCNVDGNLDDAISADETGAAKHLSSAFGDIDANKDSAVSAQELYAYVAKQQKLIAAEAERGKTCPICAAKAKTMSLDLKQLMNLK
jgi:Ca2+-binding EF-hand superfamily protein